jgi:hypothetical protein
MSYDVPIQGCDYRWGMDCILDLLTQLGTTSDYSTIVDMHTSQITSMSFQSSLVITWQRILTK